MMNNRIENSIISKFKELKEHLIDPMIMKRTKSSKFISCLGISFNLQFFVHRISSSFKTRAVLLHFVDPIGKVASIL